MVFDYYRRLPRGERRIYNQSDRIDRVKLPLTLDFHEQIAGIRDGLAAKRRDDVHVHTAALCDQLCTALDIAPVRVKLLSRRPNDEWGELQGLYEGTEGRQKARITLWMRTSVKGSVVAVRTYLRTVFHELCHHIDYEYFKLEESYHTQGFYKRESSLFKQMTRGVSLPNRRVRE